MYPSFNICSRKLWRWYAAQKMKFSIKDFFGKCDTVSCGLVTFTEGIFNRKLHFLCSDTGHFWQELSLSVQEIKSGSFKFQGMMFEILWDWTLKLYFDAYTWKRKKIKIKINKNVNKYSWFVCAINDLSTWIWASRKSSHRRILVKRYEKS